MVKVSLIGLPNVGKSTVFNKLTKAKQYTGNWSGKTTKIERKKYQYCQEEYEVTDLPGIYLLEDNLEVCKELDNSDIIVIVCNTNLLEKNLYLILQILKKYDNVLLVLNMLDETKKNNINLNIDRLSKILKLKIVCLENKKRNDIDKLKKEIKKFEIKETFKIQYLESLSLEEKMKIIMEVSKNIKEVVVIEKNTLKKSRVDKIMSKKITAIPLMLITLFLVFWLTIVGSNYPSDWLYNFFSWFEHYLVLWLSFLPDEVLNLLVYGVYRVLTWVIAVMLPPMLIFFPLFTLLEESGFLPRISFHLDKYFKKFSACGTQALTMCMGFGCNAVGVCGARTILNKKERLIAIITNSFVPCNGRFPSIIAIITMFFIGKNAGLGQTLLSALFLLIVILIGVIMTFVVSKILSLVLLKENNSLFFLELPSYRKPKILKVVTKAIVDRIFFVLGKALLIAAPAGLIIYLLANTNINGSSILTLFVNFLNPIAYLIGLDGEILVSFILGFPANEIVIPIMMMSYMQQGVLQDYDSLITLKMLLVDNGWTIITAVCFIIFALMHFPCSTTCLTIKKETNSWFYTFLAFIIPLISGSLICLIITSIYHILL